MCELVDLYNQALGTIPLRGEGLGLTSLGESHYWDPPVAARGWSPSLPPRGRMTRPSLLFEDAAPTPQHKIRHTTTIKRKPS